MNEEGVLESIQKYRTIWNNLNLELFRTCESRLLYSDVKRLLALDMPVECSLCH